MRGSIGCRKREVTATGDRDIQIVTGLNRFPLSQIALDRYVFVREAYLARRRSAVYDGEPPEEVEPDTGNSIPAPQP